MTDLTKGDLAVVIRWPCCGLHLGNIFTVERIAAPELFKCLCGAMQFTAAVETANSNGSLCWAPLAWVKRIPPLAELESTEHKEETLA